MCGRFTITVDLNDLKDYLSESFDIHDLSPDIIVPRYNVAPGQQVLAVIHDGKSYRVGLIKWGFVPSFAKDESIGFSMINAKSETIHEKPAFKKSLKSQRCLILADGFYEWMKENNKKQPYRILLNNEKIFPMAGLWSTYVKENGEKLHTATIITTSANDLMKPIHDRMPVILDEKGKTSWLNPIFHQDDLLNLLKPFDDQKMKAYPVSDKVNKPANDDPSLIGDITDLLKKVPTQTSLFE